MRPTPTPRRPSVSVVLNGDVLLHAPLWRQAAADAARPGERYDFGPMLADLAPVVGSADLAIAHLETPLGPADGPFSSYPVFAVPPQIAIALHRLGYAGATTASNHSLDGGFEGVERTIRTLDAAGLQHAGTARTGAGAGEATTFRVSGVRVALLAYAYGFNGFRLPGDQPWAANLIDTDAMLSAAARARRSGADIVLVAVHAGEQYVHGPNAEQRRVFDTLTRSADVDFVYGHHAHVVQPVQQVNGRWVAYGLGNAVSNNEPWRTDTPQGLTLRVPFTADADGRYRAGRPEAVPTYCTVTSPYRWHDARRPTGSVALDRKLRRTVRDVLADAGDHAGPAATLLAA